MQFVVCQCLQCSVCVYSVRVLRRVWMTTSPTFPLLSSLKLILLFEGLSIYIYYRLLSISNVYYIVIQTWSSRDLSLGLETSRDPFLQVSVLVLEPRSLGLGLGLGTLQSRSWSWSLLVRQIQTLGLKWHAVTRTKCCIHC